MRAAILRKASPGVRAESGNTAPFRRQNQDTAENFSHESTQMLHRWYLTTVLSFPRDVIHHLVGRKGKRQLGQSA